MRLANVKRGDRIEACVRGFKFEATVVNPRCPEIPSKPVRVDPVPSNVSFYHLSAHQVKRVLA